MLNSRKKGAHAFLTRLLPYVASLRRFLVFATLNPELFLRKAQPKGLIFFPDG
jgi:hypothetical protein